MPELPDLVYIEKKLGAFLPGRTITDAWVRDSIVLRVAVAQTVQEALIGRTLEKVRRHGPFLVLGLAHLELVVHFMLSGRFRLVQDGIKRQRKDPAELCFSLQLDNGWVLDYLDDRRMGKLYVIPEKDYRHIPGFSSQGIDVLSEDFTLETFRRLIQKRRQQVRVFLMDQTALSAIGNAYADEILFAARLHPKTGCHQLRPQEVERLYGCIGSVLLWGIEQVQKAEQPIEVKFREHLKVRGRKGQPCPACGTTIRRVGVLGYDSFFCPRCQPAQWGLKSRSIPWT